MIYCLLSSAIENQLRIIYECVLWSWRWWVQSIVWSITCKYYQTGQELTFERLFSTYRNALLQVCRNCQPAREYLRLFDVTERTGMRRHKTGRVCHKCKSPLLDTIIHFGEKSPFQSPHNWQQVTTFYIFLLLYYYWVAYYS